MDQYEKLASVQVAVQVSGAVVVGIGVVVVVVDVVGAGVVGGAAVVVVEVVELGVSALKDMAARGEILDAKTLILIHAL